jgi:phosphotransferase system enzyme I (PtsI)
LLSTQLRALLRAATKSSIGLLLPAVVGADDVAAFRSVLEGVKRSLLADGHPIPASMPIGAMIELPAAALTLPVLARSVDFFTVGLDDLVPNLLGSDRDDPASASDELPHPAVPRILDLMREAAFRTHRPLYVSGELAANPHHTALLLGLGLRRFSVAPARLGELRERIQRCRIGEAEALAQRALAQKCPLVAQEQATT